MARKLRPVRDRIEKRIKKGENLGFMSKKHAGYVRALKGKATTPKGFPKSRMFIFTSKAGREKVPNGLIAPRAIRALGELIRHGRAKTGALVGLDAEGKVAGYTVFKIDRPISNLEEAGLNGALSPSGLGFGRSRISPAEWDKKLKAEAKQKGINLRIRRLPMPGYVYDKRSGAFIKMPEMEGLTIQDEVFIPKREMAKTPNTVTIARLREELEILDSRWLQDTMVQAVEIDRRAVGITYDQHVEMLEEVAKRARAGGKPKLPGSIPKKPNQPGDHTRI